MGAAFPQTSLQNSKHSSPMEIPGRKVNMSMRNCNLGLNPHGL